MELKTCAVVSFGHRLRFAEACAAIESAYRCVRYRDALAVEVGDAQVFVFAYAALVQWGGGMEERQRLLERLQPHVEAPLPSLLREELRFRVEPGAPFRIQNDTIQLPGDGVLDKLAVSHAMAQSITLEQFETEVARTIEVSKPIPEALAATGRTRLTRRQLSKLRGQLYLVKSNVNLHYDLLDKPEFFWEYPELDALYLTTYEYQEVGSRLDILNRRLEVIGELLEILADEEKHNHSSTLEWIIIWLIAVEIVIFIGHDFLKLF